MSMGFLLICSMLCLVMSYAGVTFIYSFIFFSPSHTYLSGFLSLLLHNKETNLSDGVDMKHESMMGYLCKRAQPQTKLNQPTKQTNKKNQNKTKKPFQLHN